MSTRDSAQSDATWWPPMGLDHNRLTGRLFFGKGRNNTGEDVEVSNQYEKCVM